MMKFDVSWKNEYYIKNIKLKFSSLNCGTANQNQSWCPPTENLQLKTRVVLPQLSFRKIRIRDALSKLREGKSKLEMASHNCKSLIQNLRCHSSIEFSIILNWRYHSTTGGRYTES